MKRVILVLLAVAAIALFFGMALAQHLTLGALKENRGKFAAMLEQSPLRVTLIAIALYVIVMALSLPDILFGFWYGALFVSFASTIGATLALLTSRYLPRDFVEHRFGGKLKTINDGMAKNGALYLFMLLPFASLGVFPLIARRVVQALPK